MTAETGEIAKTIGIEIVSGVQVITCTVGDVVQADITGGWRPASITNITGNLANGFGVALETGTSATSNIRVAIGNTYVYAVSGTGDTVPWQLVGPGVSGEEGQTLALTMATMTATAVIQVFARVAGRYMGHEGEEDAPTAATTAEVVIIRLGL